MSERDGGHFGTGERRPAAAGRRIWHQSMTDLSRLPGYRANLEQLVTRSVHPRTEVQIHGMREGTYPDAVAPIVALRSPWLHHLLATQIVLGAIRAQEEGFDCVTVGCFFDPGVREARELVRIPVLGAFECAVRAAMAEAGSCALIALDDNHAGFLQDLAQREGVADGVSGTYVLDPPTTEYEIDGGVAPAVLLARLERAAERAQADGARSLVAAEGVLNALLSTLGIRTMAGLVVIDGLARMLAQADTERPPPSRDPGDDALSADARRHIQRVTAEELLVQS